MHFYFIIVFILSISNVTPLTTVTPDVTTVRPRCPPPTLTPDFCARARFRFMCNVDSDCKEKDKICCNNGCVGACVTPQSMEVMTQNVTCPPPSLTSDQCMYAKFPSCESDATCTENKKCCDNGCGTTCMTPRCTKSGSCPSENVNCVWSQCQSDCDCPGAQKCCHGCLCV